VPRIVCLEEDPRWLGTPFLVTRQVAGQIPGDSPPYVVAGWMTELSETDLATLEQNTIRELAAIHTIRSPGDLDRFRRPDLGPTPLQQQLAYQNSYYEWARDGRRVPVIEEAFGALSASVPPTAKVTLNWGDSRIGNIIYRDLSPVAILDWEMATAGPPEVDVAWMVFMHRFFQDSVSPFGLRGMPDFLDTDRVIDLYEVHSGDRLDSLGWYQAFAGLRFAIILFRMSLRSIAFGVRQPTDDADALVLFAPLLRRLLESIDR
jgi:aminoglycoside phosphotransferase (APT) family kinase protein